MFPVHTVLAFTKTIVAWTVTISFQSNSNDRPLTANPLGFGA